MEDFLGVFDFKDRKTKLRKFCKHNVFNYYDIMSKTGQNDLTEKIQMEIGISLSDSKIFEEIIEEILCSLEHGNDVKISNFGTFSIKRKILGLKKLSNWR